MCQEILDQGLLEVLEVEETFQVESVYKVWEEEVKDQIGSFYDVFNRSRNYNWCTRLGFVNISEEYRVNITGSGK